VLFQGLKIPYVLPEKNSNKTLEIGTLYAPEEICYPFKLVLGNCISGIERGADTILITGSCGPCRFGEYCELLMRILRDLGYRNLSFVVADLSPEIGWKEFCGRIEKITSESPVSPFEQLLALQRAYRTVALCDKLDAEACRLAGLERERGQCRRILQAYKERLPLCESPEEALRLLGDTREALDLVELDPEKNPLRVAIIGEIFTVIEPFSSLYLEEKLMEYGVSSFRKMSPSWWVKDLVMKPLRCNSRKIFRCAGNYLPYPVGGHGRECVGEAVLAKKEGMDGAIQLFPMGCMPEVVAKSVLPAISRDLDFPIMTLVLDEGTGEAGFITRIEAFLDLLSARKKRAAGLASGFAGDPH